MVTVLITEGMHEEGIGLLQRAGFSTVTPGDTFQVNDVQIIVVRSVFQINNETLTQYPSVKIVAKLGTGIDNIDQALCASKGIEVLSVPGMNAISTAEFAVTQILNIFKNSFEIYTRVQNRDFRRNLYYGKEISGYTAGVIGFGKVGKAIADRLRPFVKELYIRDRHTEGDVIADGFHFVADQNTLLDRCDIVILAVPLKSNKKMGNQVFLENIKENCVLINIARGGLIDEQALVAFLKSHPDARYYCDVTDPEPNYFLPPEEQPYQSSLFNLPNVLYTPHIANLTDECQRRIALTIADNIITVCKEKKS